MIALSGVDFEIKQYDMTAGRGAARGPAEAMRFDGKTPGNLGVEPHHSFFPGTHRQVAIITVQVQVDHLVGGKRELEHRGVVMDRPRKGFLKSFIVRFDGSDFGSPE
jgi:hypothetical protein